MSLRVDFALDEPQGIERAIRIAAAQKMVILCTRAWLRDTHLVDDVGVATRRGLRIVVFLQEGCTPKPGTFPDSARIVPWDFEQQNQKELLVKMREVLAS